MSLSGKKAFQQAAKPPAAASVAMDENVITFLQFNIWSAQTDKLRQLLKHYPQLVNHHIENHNGVTPLHLAASRGNAAIVTLLIDHGANIEARDIFLNTPLHYSASHYYTHDGENDLALEALLKNGADVTAANKNGITPLLDAVRHKQESAALLLIRHGADPFEKTRFCNHSAADAAKERNNYLLLVKMEDAARQYKANLQKPRKTLSFASTQPRRVTSIKSFKSIKNK